ncbi:hypothetical protein [Streptomyces sp. SM13]|uniref:hypothetical protein n=1 Tax=Streptomyces sp. SM13 TaxID=1983803 RepID=UPI0035BBD6BE
MGFGVTRLLNVGLLPRIKQINRVRLYRPNAGVAGAYPNLQAVCTASPSARLRRRRAQGRRCVARPPVAYWTPLQCLDLVPVWPNGFGA